MRSELVRAAECPDSLVSDRVVFVIMGRSSNHLVPLADAVDFRFDRIELPMRIDDPRYKSKFSMKEMILRSEWDLM